MRLERVWSLLWGSGLVFPTTAWMPPSPPLSVPFAAKPTTTTVLPSTPGIGSYVEGDTFDDPRDEVEALGGDPFFLEDDDDNAKSSNPDDDDFLWDGEIDENAHLDLDLE